mgnify:CR=1 FL=1
MRQPGDTIALESGDTLLEVSPVTGGSITRYATAREDRVFEWMRPATEAAILERSAGQTASFPMVPFSNRIRNGRFSFDGRDVQLTELFGRAPHAIHGHGWLEPWNIVEQADDTLTLEYRHPADSWPWAYRAEQTFELRDAVLTIRFAVTNEATTRMPLGFGLHPYFVRTPGVRLHAGVGEMWRADDDAMPAELVPPPPQLAFGASGLSPDLAILDNNFLSFGGEYRIEWPEWRAGLRVEADPVYSCLVVYTPEGRDFFCAEPATNCIDAVNLAASGREDTGLIGLAADDTAAGEVVFTPAIRA